MVDIPKINFLAVRGCGNPNLPDGEYKKSIELLYGIAFTIKMSYKTDYKMDGYFSYVVPPLEGLWWQEGGVGIDYQRKEDFQFISLIRLPDFVTKEYFDWAVEKATSKKKKDFSRVEFFTYEEAMTVKMMDDYAKEEGDAIDITEKRYHHEIYLSDPRKCDSSRLKTVIRYPVKKIN